MYRGSALHAPGSLAVHRFAHHSLRFAVFLIPPFQPTVGRLIYHLFTNIVRMKIATVPLALVAVLQCYSVAVFGGDPPPSLMDAAAKKAAEEFVAVPIGEAWRDIYDSLVRKKGSKLARKMRFALAGTLGKSEPLDLAVFLMDKLKKEVFKGQVNEKAWKALTMELYFAIKEWWSLTPENPKDAADLGAWHALVNMYKEILAPALRGSNRVGTMNELLLDPELKNIRKWISEWKGSPLPEVEAPAGSGQLEDEDTDAEKE